MNYKKLSILPLLSILTTLSFAEGEPTEVKTWNIREHSVKVAFKDNLLNSGYRFRVIDEDGTRIDGLNVSNLSTSSQNYLIRKISGLKSGTHYFVTVISKADAKIRSEQIGFTTTGDKPDTGDIDEREAPTNLKTWNLRETSVKIGFEDNHLGTDYRFRVVNQDGTRIDGLRTSFKKSSQKDYIMGRISGLKEGTFYSVTVIAEVDDKIRSKPIEFRTKGIPANQRVATNLKVWGVKSNSAMISFIHTPPIFEHLGDTAYFYDEDRKKIMTLNSKGIIPVPDNPKYSIGKMINLTPNTTYRVSIRDGLGVDSGDLWFTLEKSKIIEFTTKK